MKRQEKNVLGEGTAGSGALKWIEFSMKSKGVLEPEEAGLESLVCRGEFGSEKS